MTKDDRRGLPFAKFDVTDLIPLQAIRVDAVGGARLPRNIPSTGYDRPHKALDPNGDQDRPEPFDSNPLIRKSRSWSSWPFRFFALALPEAEFFAFVFALAVELSACRWSLMSPSWPPLAGP